MKFIIAFCVLLLLINCGGGNKNKDKTTTSSSSTSSQSQTSASSTPVPTAEPTAAGTEITVTETPATTPTSGQTPGNTNPVGPVITGDRWYYDTFTELTDENKSSFEVYNAFESKTIAKQESDQNYLKNLGLNQDLIKKAGVYYCLTNSTISNDPKKRTPYATVRIYSNNSAHFYCGLGIFKTGDFQYIFGSIWGANITETASDGLLTVNLKPSGLEAFSCNYKINDKKIQYKSNGQQTDWYSCGTDIVPIPTPTATATATPTSTPTATATATETPEGTDTVDGSDTSGTETFTVF